MTDAQVSASNSALEDLQFLVPVYNEGENVRVLYENLQALNIPFRTLSFIYDFEEDSTLPVIAKLKENDDRVEKIRNNIGKGVVNALKAGFAEAKDGPVIVLMGDNSDKLDIIPEMVSLWESGAVVVCPSRYMPGGKQHGGGLIKANLSRIACTSLKKLGFPTADATNNFKLYDGAWLRNQEIESTGGFEIAMELCYKAYCDDLLISELPTEWYDRTEGESNFQLRKWIPKYLHWYWKIVREILRRR